jgi:hypothetical protein
MLVLTKEEAAVASIGKVKMDSPQTSSNRYDQMVESIRKGAEGLVAHKGDALPLLAVCSAFDDFNALSIGRGLDEEALTSLFLGHLGSSIRHASCILQSDEGASRRLGLRWLHYSRPAENIFGSDFALLVAAPGREERYRLAVFQAKRWIGSKINLKRAPNWNVNVTSNGDGAPMPAMNTDKEELRKRKETADKQLESYLNVLKDGAEVDADAISMLEKQQHQDAWQLTKLVILALRLGNSFQLTEAVSVNYVLWPERTGQPVTYAPVANATLEAPPDAVEQAKVNEERRNRTQHLVPPEHQLRDLLMTWLTKEGSTVDSLDVSQAADACKLVTDCNATVAILDLRSPGHALTLDAALDERKVPLAKPAIALDAYVAPVAGVSTSPV